MGHILRQRLRQERFDGPHHESVLNLLVAAAHMRAEIEAVCQEHALTGAQYNVLRILRGARPAGFARCEIAARMIERAPDLTRLVDRLIAAGMVERSRPAEDRRRSVARITRRGLDMLERIQPRFDEIHRAFAARVPTQDARELSRICERVYEPALES